MQWKRIFRYRIKKVSQKEVEGYDKDRSRQHRDIHSFKEMCARTVNRSQWCSGTLIFLECSSMLNAAPVTNAFWSCTWLSRCFFLTFFFYILTKSLFYRLVDNVLMKTYSLCGRRGHKKDFKETKICGIIASKWILFIQRFSWLSIKMNWVSYLPFPFPTINLPLKCINRVGVLINNHPAVQFSYKCEFILCKNWGISYKYMKTVNCWSSTK